MIAAVSDLPWYWLIALVVYLLSAAVVAIDLGKDLIRGVMADVSKRVASDYRPAETVGGLLGDLLLIVIPLGNTALACFILSESAWPGFVKGWRCVMDLPLVPPKK